MTEIAGGRRSKSEVYLHLVWTTRHRVPLLVDPAEAPIHRTLEATAKRLGCVVMALNGTVDHVHVLVMIPPSVSGDELIHHLWADSETVAREIPGLEDFEWGESYGVFSVSRSHVKRVMAYLLEQKRAHETGAIWPEWEETDEEAPEEDAWKTLL